METEKTQENQVEQPNLEQTPVAVEGKKPNTLLIVILLIAILLIPAGVYAGMQIGKKQVSPGEIISESKTPTQAVVTVQPEPTTITTPDATANWKTYTNSEFGFSFRYPSTYFDFFQDYLLRLSDLDNLDNQKLSDLDKVKTNRSMVVELANKKEGSLLRIWVIKTDRTPEKWATEIGDCPNSSEHSSPSCVMNSGLIPGSTLFESNKDRPSQFLETFIGKKGILYEFAFSLQPNDFIEDKLRNTYDQILSTFKFLD